MKKFAALALSFLLAVTMFAGCRRNVGNETTVPATNAPTEQSTAPTANTRPSTQPSTPATQMPSATPDASSGRMPRH